MEFLRKSNTPLLIFYHSSCTEHFVPRHPECPGRVASILKALQKEWPSYVFREAPECSHSNILRFHTESHLSGMKELFASVETARINGSKKQNELMQMIDGDTAVMWGTKEASYRAVGSVISAVDEVLTNSVRSAFCCVRPPGHHAERSRACGFCFFNNAGIGAKHAQAVYGIKKVAVVDFDVHHGNGTEEGFADDESLFYGSTHQQYAFPGTGQEPVLLGDESVSEKDRRIVNRFLTAGEESQGQFRRKWLEVLQEMERFGPGLVIISAGFDAHSDDPLADCCLTVEDFAWATQEVWASCRRINPAQPPPIVSVLEGGYDLDALAACAVAHVRALAMGPGDDVDVEGEGEGGGGGSNVLEDGNLQELEKVFEDLKLSSVTEPSETVTVGVVGDIESSTDVAGGNKKDNMEENEEEKNNIIVDEPLLEINESGYKLGDSGDTAI